MRYISDIISAVKARQAEISVALAHGNASDYAVYQRYVGEYKGLEDALEIINNLLEDEDDDR